MVLLEIFRLFLNTVFICSSEKNFLIQPYAYFKSPFQFVLDSRGVYAKIIVEISILCQAEDFAKNGSGPGN